MTPQQIKTLAKRYARFIRWSEEDACFIGSLPDLVGDCTHGDTPEEVAANLNECAELFVENALMNGETLPEPHAKIIIPSTFRQGGSENKISALRKQYGYTQKSFAALIGVSLSTLIKWENGVRTPCGSSAKLLEILAHHPEYLDA